MLLAEGWSTFEIMVWPGAGWIGLILWCLSIAMIALVIENFMTIRRTHIVPLPLCEQVRGFFEGKQYREAIELTANEPSMFSYIVHAGLAEAPYGYASMERAVDAAAEERLSSLLRHVEWLNLIGNIGPMLGLLGTVYGMILMFFGIVAAGGVPDPGKLAAAIGIKLVSTLLGLMVAIPSLAVYGFLRNRIDGLSSEAVVSAQELIANFRPGRKGAPPAE